MIGPYKVVFAVLFFSLGLLSGVYNPLIVEEIRGHCTDTVEGRFTKTFSQLDDEGMSQAIGYWKGKGWTVQQDWANMSLTISCNWDGAEA